METDYQKAMQEFESESEKIADRIKTLSLPRQIPAKVKGVKTKKGFEQK